MANIFPWCMSFSRSCLSFFYCFLRANGGLVFVSFFAVCFDCVVFPLLRLLYSLFFVFLFPLIVRNNYLGCCVFSLFFLGRVTFFICKTDVSKCSRLHVYVSVFGCARSGSSRPCLRIHLVPLVLLTLLGLWHACRVFMPPLILPCHSSPNVVFRLVFFTVHAYVHE